MIPSQKALIDGLHQYAMHLYKVYTDSGYSEDKASQAVVETLQHEIAYFTKVKTETVEEQISRLEAKVEAAQTEEERYKLLKELETAKSLAKR